MKYLINCKEYFTYLHEKGLLDEYGYKALYHVLEMLSTERTKQSTTYTQSYAQDKLL